VLILLVEFYSVIFTHCFCRNLYLSHSFKWICWGE